MLKHLSIAILILSSIACKETKSPASDTAVSPTATSYQGVYEGTLPCADCSGIATTLTLEEQQAATYRTFYLDKSDTAFVEKGTYEVSDSILTLTLPKEQLYFAISSEKLTLLTPERQRIEGNLAPYYELKKVQ